MEPLEGALLCFPQLANSSCRRPMRSRFQTVFLYTLLSSIALLTVLLNLLVIISISHFKQLHTSTNLLLLSLAVSDFLVGLLVMPIEILFTLTCWYLGDIMCAVCYILIFIITSASVGNMVLISIDRYVAICDPLRYPIKVTRRRVKICVSLCWLCSVFFNGFVLKEHLTHPSKYNTCHGECVVVIDYIAGSVDLVFTFFVPVTVILILYMRVFIVAVSQARSMRSHVVAVRSSTVTETAKKSERKAARTLGIVIVVFLLCFCPYYYPPLAGQDTVTSTLSVNILVWILFFNSCINPLIYAFFYPWFRKAIKLTVTLQILKPDSCETTIL